MPPRTLSVVPTPLGNLGDITLRALDTLRIVDAICAEDTRETRHLLTHYQITKPLLSYPKFEEAAKLDGFLERLRSGQHLALCTDRGTPGIADPGGRLLRAVLDDPSLTLEVLPGPTAITTALLRAGYAEQPFTFRGFVPRKAKERSALWAQVRYADTVTVLYEAPTRILATLASAVKALGEDREAALAKELTKLHEAVFRGPLGGLSAQIPADAVRGEFVLLIGSANNAAPQGPALQGPHGLDPLAIAKLLVATELRPQEARAILAQLAGVSASSAYAWLEEAKAHARD